MASPKFPLPMHSRLTTDNSALNTPPPPFTLTFPRAILHSVAEKCLRCFRPLSTCYCRHITPVETGVKFVFLMHPKEAYHQHTGTGRLASLSLPDSEIIVGVDFTQNKRLNSLLDNNHYFPLVLYPADDAYTAQSVELRQALRQVGGGEREGAQPVGPAAASKTLLVIVVDATWFFAKKMLRLSPNVRSLPKLSFQRQYQSEFTFKRQPAAGCVSTIESCYHLIRELQAAGLVDVAVDPSPLMSVFRRMVDFQLEAEQARIAAGIPGRHSYDAQRDANRKKRLHRQRVENPDSAKS